MFTRETAEIGVHYPQYSDKRRGLARLWLESRVDLLEGVKKKKDPPNPTDDTPAGRTESTPSTEPASTLTIVTKIPPASPWEPLIPFLEPCHVRPWTLHNVAVALDMSGHILSKVTLLFNYQYAKVWIHLAIYLAHQLVGSLEDAFR